MKRLIVLVTVIALGQNVLFAAGPLEEAAKQAALAQSAGQVPKASTHSSSRKVLLWTGVAAAGAGTGLMLWGMNRCENLGGTIQRCTESDGLKWLGIGTAAAGGVLLGIGASKHSDIRILPTSVSYRLKF